MLEQIINILNNNNIIHEENTNPIVYWAPLILLLNSYNETDLNNSLLEINQLDFVKEAFFDVDSIVIIIKSI